MGKKRMAFKPPKPKPDSGEENKEESSDESLLATPPPSPPQASEADEPKRTKEGHHSSHGGRKTRLTAAKRPTEDTDGNDAKKMKIGMEEGHHSNDGGRKTRLASAKRPSQDTDGNDVKKAKSEKKSNSFPRVWSEDDEIVLLNGILDYSNEMGTGPNEDWNAFSEFMRGKVDLDFTKVQLQDKIRWLKKKFIDNKGKKGKDKKNKERAFSTPHEQSVYDLSTQVWGNETSKPDGNASEFEEINDGGNAVVEKPNRKVNVSVVEEIKDGGNAVVEKPNRKANASVVEEIKDGGNAVVEKPNRKANASVVEEIKDGVNAVGEKINRKANASVFEEIKDGPNAVGKKHNKKVTASVFGEVEDGGDGGKWKELNPSAGIEETMLLYGKQIYESVHGNEEKTEWHKLRVEEMELYLKQLEVRVMQTKLILSAMKREDHKGEDEHA